MKGAAGGAFVAFLLAATAAHANVSPKQWCYTRPKYFTQVLKIPEKVCRPVWTLFNARPSPDAVGDVARKPARLPTFQPAGLERTDAVTAKQMMGLFPGLFLNKTTARELTTKMKKGLIFPRPGKRPRPINPSGAIDPSVEVAFKGAGHDGDLHCPTFRNLNQAPNRMANVQNEPKDVVHFPTEGVFQYVHQGTCGSASTQNCGGGGCFQEKSIVYLMVWTENPDWPTGFEPFEVESYCSCKGVTS